MPTEFLADRALAPFFRDRALWPVTLVLAAHAVLGLALVLVDVRRSPGGFSLGALALVGAATVSSVARDLARGRFGLASRALAGCWLLAALSTWVVERTGLY